jgi:spore germination protein YaaH
VTRHPARAFTRILARLLSHASLALLASACATGRGLEHVTPTSGERFFVAGYHPYWADDAWTLYPWDVLDEVYFFEIEVAADGTLADAHGWPDAGLSSRAAEAGVRVVPTVSLHDAAAFSALFADPARADRLVEQLIALLEATPGLAGIHLDFEVFEPVDPEVRDGYTAFVASVERRMADVDPSWSLSVFALAFDDDDVFDERAIAESADFLVVQGYDFHSRAEASTGPLAALRGWGRLNWETVVERFRAFDVPSRKLVMAVPLYGYQWPAESDAPGAATRGVAVEMPLTARADVMPDLPRAHAQAELYGLRRDLESGAPYYAFQDSNGWHQGWLEDAESLRAKYAFIRERGLGGVALFPLAYGNAAMWEDLRDAFSRPRE